MSFITNKISGFILATGTPNVDDSLVFDGSTWNFRKPDALSIGGFEVSTNAPTAGDSLIWDGSIWNPSTVGVSGNYNESTDLTGPIVSPTVIRLRNNFIANQSLGVDQDGYQLTWNNSVSNWQASPSTLSDSYANLPASGNVGRLFLPTDDLAIFRDDGSQWKSFGPIHSLVTPPIASVFTKLNSSTATLVDDGSQLVLTSSLSTNERWVHPDTLGATFQIDIAYSIRWYNSAVGQMSISIMDGDLVSSSAINFTVYSSGTGANIANFIAQISTWSSTATATSEASATTVTSWLFSSPLIWLRILQDNTNRTYYISNNGRDYQQLYQESNAAFITPTNWGLHSIAGSSVATVARIYSINVQ